MNEIKQLFSSRTYIASRFILLTAGALIAASSLVLFLLPANIAPSGVSGISVVVNRLIGIPIGLLILLLNIPIQLLGFRMLSGWKTVLFTVYSVVVFSAAVEIIPILLPDGVQISDDRLLSAIFGGVIGGVGAGLIYRAGGTVGGTSTLARILRNRSGMPMSTASIFTDTLVLLLVGIVLGWEAALYALIALFINRTASDYVVEGSSETNMALIVTDQPHELYMALHDQLEHGIVAWTVQGMEWGNEHTLVMVTILRSEVYKMVDTVRRNDQDAFITVLQGHAAYGGDFKTWEPQLPLNLDKVDV